jgi:4-aminobutyrate aminotransferase / (S)-3-amino-2-methylpropionate transaminase / 5-aminovalerate transaminase
MDAGPQSSVLPETPTYRLPQTRSVARALPGPRSLALGERRRAAVADGVTSAHGSVAVDLDGGILVDADDNRLVDFASGIAVTGVGGSSPRVQRAVAEQVGHFTHACFTVSPYESYVAVCEALAELTPGDHDKRSVLLSTGAEAVENAVKIARHATGRGAIVVFDHAYHGRTNLTMAMTAKAMPYKAGFGPFAPEIYRMPLSYPFRDGLAGEVAAERAITAIERQIGADAVAAIVIEPIQGEGGFIVPAAGFLPALREWATARGVLFIADEIQTGFCRTGDWFASEHEGVVPDLITTAKGIAGGLPLSGVTGRAEIMNAVHGGGLGGTYAGNPLACAAALATIEDMRAFDLVGAARRIGDRIAPVLAAAAHSVPLVGEVRGRGAMQAIEIVRPGTTEPDAAATGRIARAAYQRGVVVLTCGTDGNVLRLLPPLVIGDALLADGLAQLVGALEEVAAG